MVGGNAIRGTRIGAAGPSSESERGETAPRSVVSYWCANGHESRLSFALDAEIPNEWDCPKCGLPGGQDVQNPPSSGRTEPFKSHLEYVKERRSDEEGEALLEEALEKLRQRRGRA
ncbi:RNA polymerase-binding protein [Prauserella aidingensis]|uniref:RNA polymerase-binding protein RbpA n=1 Tax=Prauserella aidingensis TaxID=387890 RepID=UPI0020A3B428|nr:RNA polymerase-binding protein RbpA [Prauserella aidingensis]MCP2255724.1 RNA polymerase-binding protein [Prauserella aidingensis]